MDGQQYLLIGHVSKDLTPDGPSLGGTVTFSALTAQVLGANTGIVTSYPPGMADLLHPLAGIDLFAVDAQAPTSYRNVYTPEGRRQTLISRATPLDHTHIPPDWQKPDVVHLAPIADEVDSGLISHFPDALVGLTPQGWMRQWDKDGLVGFKPWVDAEQSLRRADATILSMEDVYGNEAIISRYAAVARLLVVTRGASGCTVYLEGQAHDIAAPAYPEVDPTGAGDIFAAAFLTRLRLTGEPIEAARFATVLASLSVTRAGVRSIPSTDDVQTALDAIDS